MRGTAAALVALTFSTAFAQTPADPTTIAYARNGTPEQTMDVYWPAARPTAAVLFIHGGSLQESGERRTSAMYRNVCAPFVSSGITCASMDYRLAPTHKWPAMPNDVALAVASLRELIIKRNGDPQRLFLFGHSSGCHLAAIVATNPVFLRSVNLQTRDIAGIIPMGCTLDRDDATVRNLTAESIRTGFSREQQDVATYGTPENYLAANPASFIGPHVPPTLLIVADRERFMPPILEQGSRFVRRLLELEIPANIVIVPGGHMSSIDQIQRPGDPTFAAIRKFIADPRAPAAPH